MNIYIKFEHICCEFRSDALKLDIEGRGIVYLNVYPLKPNIMATIKKLRNLLRYLSCNS